MPLDSAAYITEHRFGYGPKAGRVSSAANPRDWLLSQLQSPAAPPELSRLPNAGMLLAKLRKLQKEQKQLQDGGDAGRLKDALKDLREDIVAGYQDEVDARFRILASTETPFVERLVWFWANHFAVSGEKGRIVSLLGLYEREAIRPQVMGTFANLLQSAAQHPAMILYLDNQASVSPEAAEMRRAMAERRGREIPKNAPSGINENLAREIMELHTLGVDGGYTQADVTRFAHVLTGWSVNLNDENVGFRFAPRLHDDAPQEILGKIYTQTGIEQGNAVLSDLAHHPSTARHIARKLAGHFIADDPPQTAVDRIAQVFMDSGGHLPAVYQAVVESPEAWQPFTKTKSVIEYVASVLRLFPEAHPEPKKLLGSLGEMGQKPWFPPSPQGWPDVASRWITPDGLWKRMEWAGTIAARVPTNTNIRAMADALYGPLLSPATAEVIAGAEDTGQAMSLLLLSPEFQRR